MSFWSILRIVAYGWLGLTIIALLSPSHDRSAYQAAAAYPPAYQPYRTPFAPSYGGQP